MSRILSAVGALVDKIKINVLTREFRGGRAFWIKRRRWTARPVMVCANHFFFLAGNPIQTLTDFSAWRHWEVDCFLRLHGERFHAFAADTSAVAAEEVPGRNLSDHLSAGSLVSAMLVAAGRELRRAHEFECPVLGGRWSHGDPHAGNFVYDPAEDRARLIDFEVMHDPGMASEERQADDLLIFLQDIAGRLPAAQWVPCAHAFLAGYERPEIVRHLREKLVVPQGLARVWWAVRTTYLAPAELQRRIVALRTTL